MKTSSCGLAVLEAREGDKLQAYRDSRGLWTIGVGHLTNAYPAAAHTPVLLTATDRP